MRALSSNFIQDIIESGLEASLETFDDYMFIYNQSDKSLEDVLGMTLKEYAEFMNSPPSQRLNTLKNIVEGYRTKNLSPTASISILPFTNYGDVQSKAK